jgi:hypothetical protein
MKREFKTVTITLDELEKLARAREDDLNEWSLCKLHVNSLTGNLEMLFWTTNEKLARAEAEKKMAVLKVRKEELELLIQSMRNYLEPQTFQFTAPPENPNSRTPRAFLTGGNDV